MDTQLFWKWFENISNGIGIIGAFISLLIWYKIRRQNKLIRESARKIPQLEGFAERTEWGRGVSTVNPGALCFYTMKISATGIENEVREFFRQQGMDKQITKFFNVPLDDLKPEGMESVIQQIRTVRNEIQAANITEVHLFVAGPVQLGTLIGSMLDHWKPVKLYSKNLATKSYEYWCMLEK